MSVPLHLCLMGDLILDNASYVKTQDRWEFPCVREQFAARVPKVTLLAMDGARMFHVRDLQIPAIPESTTHVLLSVGGNDGLGAFVDLARRPWEALKAFFTTFRAEYDALIQEMMAALPKGARLAVCTVYQAQLSEAGFLRDTIASVGVRYMNYVIRSVAQQHSLDLLDLWTVFSDRRDFANAIEPGVPGGHKIVQNTLRWMTSTQTPRVFDDSSYDKDFDLSAWTHFQLARFAFTS